MLLGEIIMENCTQVLALAVLSDQLPLCKNEKQLTLETSYPSKSVYRNRK